MDEEPNVTSRYVWDDKYIYIIHYNNSYALNMESCGMWYLKNSAQVILQDTVQVIFQRSYCNKTCFFWEANVLFQDGGERVL